MGKEVKSLFVKRGRRGYDSKSEAGETHLSVLVEQAYELIGGVENVPPVKAGHAGLPPLLRTGVQEVQNVFGGEVGVGQTLVQEVHHGRVSQGVLKRWAWRCSVRNGRRLISATKDAHR